MKEAGSPTQSDAGNADGRNGLDSATSSDSNFWRGVSRSIRIAAGLVLAGAFIPLILLVFGNDHLAKWQQILAAAVFTPLGIIGEWIVLTGRTKIRS